MRFKETGLLAGLVALPVAVLLALPVAVVAQAIPNQRTGGALVELALDYTYLHANAPPGSCGCFSLNGGSGWAALNLAHGLSVVGDVSATQASHVDGTTQSLIVLNYLFGPRYSWRGHSGIFTPYGQVLLGGSSEYSNKSPVQNANSFAFSSGGGVNARLARHLGWNVAEADWLHSQLPNGGNNRQNDLRISSGLILRF